MSQNLIHINICIHPFHYEYSFNPIPRKNCPFGANLGTTDANCHLFESFKQRGIEVIFKGNYRKNAWGKGPVKDHFPSH